MSATSEAAPRAGADRSPDSYLPAHGNGGYRVQHYDLDLDYRIGPNRLDGCATISAVTDHALSRFSLDLAGLRVASVLVDGVAARFEHVRGKLRVRPIRAVEAGVGFQIIIRYGGKPRPISGPWGDIGWDELTDGAIVASQPVGAPSWFPCNDQPADKATYRVSLTTTPAYAVLVTGDLVSRGRSAGGTRWVYERAEPTATYLMSVQIGRYVDVRISGVGSAGTGAAGTGVAGMGAAGMGAAGVSVTQRAAVPLRLRRLFEIDFGRHNSIMETMQQFFGPYPFREYVIVVTDDALDDPIEAQGMSIFGANHLDGLRTYERLAAHELAHQWFGNSLTVADWRHIWLNEGFATYAEWLWSDVCGGSSVEALAKAWHARLSAMPEDLRIGDPGVTRMFDVRLYKRGGLTLHALRSRIGDQAFFVLLRAWTAEHRHGTVTTDQFTAAASRHAGFSLDEFFAAWLWRPSLPPLPG